MENKVLATVNGREITETDMMMTISKFSPQEQQQFLYGDARNELINHLVSIELIYNDAVEKGIEKDEKCIAELEAAKKEIVSRVALSKVLNEVKVSDQEIEDYYNANKEKYMADANVSAKHILVDSIEKAEQVRKEIQEGKSFEAAAQEYSSCPSKANGGDLGSFTRGQMVQPFEEAAFSIDIGVLSEPVQTQFGYHIILVENRTEGTQKPFEEVKYSIEGTILQERQNFRFSNYIEELKNKYKVEIL